MASAFLNNVGTGSFVSSFNVSVPGSGNPSIAIGDLIVVVMMMSVNGAWSISDDVGNIYSIDVPFWNLGANGTMEVFSAPVLSVPSVITIDDGNGFGGTAFIYTVRGTDVSGSRVDSINGGTTDNGAGGGTQSPSATIVTTQDDIIISAFLSDTNFVGNTTPGSGWTALDTNTVFTGRFGFCEFQEVVAPGTITTNMTFTSSPSAIDIVSVSYKAGVSLPVSLGWIGAAG